ncbi:PAS domain S-box protein [bacterium]|nr:PAS domain S-box protein [bacterium]
MARRLPVQLFLPDRWLRHSGTSLVSGTAFPMSSRRPATSLRRRYFAALICIAALIVLDQFLIQPELARLASDAPVINISGRQRMLSQNLTKTALILAQATDPDQRERYRQELQELLDLWTTSQEGLQAGNADLQLPGQNPQHIKAAFEQAQPDFDIIRDATTQLIAGIGDPQRLSAEKQQQLIDTILEHEPKFLEQMHEIVSLYEAETRQHVWGLEKTSWTIAGAILATMVVLHLMAIRPATGLLEQQYLNTEDQYQAVIDSMNEGLLQLDRRGCIEFSNRQFSLMAGRDADRLRGMAAENLFTAGTLSPLLLDTASEQPRELTLLTRVGNQRTCLVSPRRLRSDDDQLRGWVLVVMDITERRETEARTQALSDQLAHADRLKSVGEIAAGLAHEVNQPLGAISNYAEGVLTRIANQQMTLDDVVQPLQRILSAALRAGSIIHSVKRFSQHRSHALVTSDINVLVQEIVELCGFELQRRQVRCHVLCQAQPPTLECDVLQIGQVLTNLIQNAAQALEQKPVNQRDLWLETLITLDDRIQILIRDNGPGIPESIRPRLFEPFSTTRIDGLGMGLSIVRSIIDAHSGLITVSQPPEGGAEFKILLPRHVIRPSLTPQNPHEVCHAG